MRANDRSRLQVSRCNAIVFKSRCLKKQLKVHCHPSIGWSARLTVQTIQKAFNEGTAEVDGGQCCKTVCFNLWPGERVF